MHSARWNRMGLLGKTRLALIPSTGFLYRLAGRRRVFLYTLRPGVEFAPNSPFTSSTGPTVTPAEDQYRLSSEVVGTRSKS